MKHLVVAQYGSFLGLSNHQLAVKHNGSVRRFPLTRLSTVSIAKRGVSFSSDIIEEFSARGIKLLFLDFRGVAHAALLGQSQHGVVAIRIAQIHYQERDTLPLAKQIVIGKIKNQRAVLNYLNKYHDSSIIKHAADILRDNAERTYDSRNIEVLLGFEGSSANIYFNSLKQSRLFSSTFTKREGRGSTEINNVLLNFGYAILSSYILNAITNAGLEPYLGVLHSKRPGKMALVFDLMEEYRAWVVDRAVIKLRRQSEGQHAMSEKIKRELISDIQHTCAKKYIYRGKKHKLEHIMQRQVYKLCGHFYGDKQYKPYLFRW